MAAVSLVILFASRILIAMTNTALTRRKFVMAALVGAAGVSISCKNDSAGGSGREVVLYTSVDEPIAKSVIAGFEKKTGIKVRLKTDTEASKTSGLVALLRAERANPQADVFWNNEPFHTINLAAEGVLSAYESPAAKDLPAQFKDSQHRWASAGLRIRMIATSPRILGVAKVEDLVADPERFKGRICMGFPALGTISGHLAALRLKWGPEKYEAFLKGLEAAEVKLLGGNSEVVKQIALGNVQVGLTDNDDVTAIEREAPGKVVGVPAATADGGPLAIPTTVGLIAGAKHDADAKQLIDYLLSPEVEAQLVAAQFALRTIRPGPTSQPALAVMDLDYVAAAGVMKEAVDKAREVLEGKK